MGKLSKILGALVLVLALALAWSSWKILKQSKQLRYRTQLLAEALSKTAKTLDSGSNASAKATYTAAADEKGEEGGELGWPKCVGVDLSQPGNPYATATQGVVKQAEDVTAQRDTLAVDLVALAEAIEVPEDKRPDVEKLKGVATYKAQSGQVEEAKGYLANRVQRDTQVKARLDRALKSNGYAKGYSGAVTATGALASDDANAMTYLDDMAKRDANLRRDLAGLLRSIGVSGSFTIRVNANGSLDVADSSAIAGIQKRFGDLNADLSTSKQRLAKAVATINRLGGTMSGMQSLVQLAKPGTKLQSPALLKATETTVPDANAFKKALDADVSVLRSAFVALQKQVKSQQAAMTAKDKEIAKLKADNAKKDGEVKQMAAILTESYQQGAGISAELSRHMSAEKAPAPVAADKVKADLMGQVKTADPQSGLVIVNLNQSQVAPGVLFMVYRGQKLQGIIMITAVNEYNSQAQVVHGKIEEMSAGDTIQRADPAMDKLFAEERSKLLSKKD